MFNGANLQRGNVFLLVLVIYIAIEIIVIMSSIVEILEILLSHSPTLDQAINTLVAHIDFASTLLTGKANNSLQLP